MRSLPIKFSALIVALLLGSCVALALLATQHERDALKAEVQRRGLALAMNLAANAKEPLLAGDDLTLESLVKKVADESGVVGVRILNRDREIQAFAGAQALEGVKPDPKILSNSAPILYSEVLVGEAEVELDLAILVDPIVREVRRQMILLTFAVLLVGIVAGVIFVRLLVGPLQRLRTGVEQLTRGDLTVRIPPSSGDEVGELTKSFNQMGESLLQKERLKTAFGRYVDDYVLQRLLENPQDQELRGVERVVTILFVDIRRFTRLSEGMKASSVVALLNDIFQRITDQIHSNEGTIDKFIGDSVMAYFGAPVPREDHPVHAVRAAIAIQDAVSRRNRESRERAGEKSIDVDLGIGIHTGSVVVGNIGSDRRMDFTVIGDAVNVAHRLEKLAAPGQILISEALQLKVRGNFKLKFEGERQLSGRVEPVHVYSVDNASWISLSSETPTEVTGSAPKREPLR